MRVAAQHGGKSANTRDVMTRERTGDLPVPFAEVTTLESIATGFRAQMFELGDDEASGGVATGAGFGTDFITLEWGERRAVVRGVDLLRAWVATFDPDMAARFPEGLR